MKTAALLRLRLSSGADRKTAELLSGDGNASSGSDFFDGGPVASGNTPFGPMLGDIGLHTEETCKAAIPAESANHIGVREHRADVGTFSPIVKRNLVPSQPMPTPKGAWQAGRNVPTVQRMPTGRPPSPPSKQEIMRRIGIRLRWVREAYGKSQSEMGAMFGISANGWGKWELGKRLPDRFTMPQLVGRLGISMEYLEGYTLDGVEKNLATLLAAAHPELVQNTSISLDTGTAPP